MDYENKWDYIIKICRDDTGIYYTDSKGDYLTVLEKDDPDDI